MRIATDGYIDLTDARHVRTPGIHVENVLPAPEEEALAFLLSHDFPGHRRIVRPMSEDERKRIALARWADSVSERMAIVDRVWRAITIPVSAPPRTNKPQLVQVLRFRDRSYPLYLDGDRTRVIADRPAPGTAVARSMTLDFGLKTA